MCELLAADVPEEHIAQALEVIVEKYVHPQYVFQVMHAGGGYRFLTKPAFQPAVATLLKHQSRRRLSASAAETLAIVAYKQPITKAQLEAIRGVNCDYAIQKLLERSLVEIKGKSEGPGRPLLYGPGKKFMEYFGINSMAELPRLKDLAEEGEESLGTPGE